MPRSIRLIFYVIGLFVAGYIAALLAVGPVATDANVCAVLKQIAPSAACKPIGVLFWLLFFLAALCFLLLLFDGASAFVKFAKKRLANRPIDPVAISKENRRRREAEAVLAKIQMEKLRSAPTHGARDVWLLDAVWRAFSGVWARPVIDLSGPGMGLLANQRFHDLVFGPFRQYSYDGDLPIWAKRRGSNLWEPIPKEFWREHSINYLTLINERPENVRAAKDSNGRHIEDWHEFMTSRDAVERLWPSTMATSKLKITTGESGYYFKTDSRMIWLTKRTLNLSVENIDTEKAISDIRVVVTTIEPETEDQGPWVLAEGFSLPAGDHKILPFARFGEASDAPYQTSKFDRCDSFIEILTGLHGPTILKDKPSIVSIRATGMETAPCNYRCKVWVDREAGRLRIMDA